MFTKSPFESNRKSTLPMYFVFAYACKIGTTLFFTFVTYSGYGPYGFSMLGGDPEKSVELETGATNVSMIRNNCFRQLSCRAEPAGVGKYD